MATVAFAYRSTKKESILQVRFLYRLNDTKTRKSIYGQTKFEVSKGFWDKYQAGTKFSGDNRDLALDLDKFKKEISEAILNAYHSVNDKSIIDKDWLSKVIHEHYNPPQPEITQTIPNKLVDYIDYYLEQRAYELSNHAHKKWGVVKNKLIRFEAKLYKSYLIKDVNEDFLKEFDRFCKEQRYSQNTAQRELAYIKSVCKHARMKGVEASPELDTLALKKVKVPKVYLTFDELKKIQELEGLGEAHDNARDWLIISCYTAQRVSDFMRFNKSMVRVENGVPVLEFTQVKTKKEMAIPLLPEVMEVLNKRGGEFPRKISDQRYNLYIKEVSQKAEINQICKGKVRECIIKDKKNATKSDYRDIEGKFEKWKFVSSHIGRRSFATNFYGKLPTTYLIGLTGHSSEDQFLNYIQKGSKDLVFDAYQQLINAKR